MKAHDYTEKGGNNTFDRGDVKGKSTLKPLICQAGYWSIWLRKFHDLNDWDNSDSSRWSLMTQLGRFSHKGNFEGCV